VRENRTPGSVRGASGNRRPYRDDAGLAYSAMSEKYERMHFEIIGDITDIEPIATGPSIRILPFLRRRYGRGRWRKLKGKTLVRLQMERFDVPNFIGLKRMALASGRCGSNASWTKDYAYPSKT